MKTNLLTTLADVFDKLAEEEESKDSEVPANFKSKKDDKDEKPEESDENEDSEESEDDSDDSNSDRAKKAAKSFQRATGKVASAEMIQKIASDRDLFDGIQAAVERQRTPPRMGGPSTKKAQAEDAPASKEDRRKLAFDRFGSAILNEKE